MNDSFKIESAWTGHAACCFMQPARKDVRDRHERRKTDDDSYRICTVFQSQHLDTRDESEARREEGKRQGKEGNRA